MLLSKSVMIGYDRHSETERVFLDDDGVINRSLGKIQSFPTGNFWGVTAFTVSKYFIILQIIL